MKETVENKCEHCSKVFARASSLLNHSCEQKRRWDERNNRANRIAFSAWLDFFKTIQPSRKSQEYIDFAKSPYYKAFVKFGIYAVETKVINPLAFVRWLLKKSVGVDYWRSDKHYTEYLIEHLKIEDPYEAVERGILRLTEMGEAENIQLADTLRYLNINRLANEVSTGRLSPWILYNCVNEDALWARFDEHQLGLIYQYIDPEVWKPKFIRDKEITNDIKNILKQAGI